MKKTITYVLNVLFILLIAFLTMRVILIDTDLKHIINDLKQAKKEWLMVGVVLVFFFVAGESVIMHYMLRMFKQKTRFINCLKYSFIGFFFSCITPSSSGGQPAQIVYMNKDGIKLGFSSLILLVITVAYKAVLVIFGFVFALFKWDFVVAQAGKWMWLLIVGLILNIAYIVGLVIIFFKPLWARTAGVKIINFLCKIHILKWKNNEKYIDKLDRVCKNYIHGAEYIKSNIHAVFNIFLITTVQRFCLFAVTYVVYRSLGLSGASFLEIVMIQTLIAITVEMLPLPGAAGVTEACFIVMFTNVFTQKLVESGMLLSRGLSFYCLLIMSAVVTFIAHFIAMKKDLSKEVKEVKEV